MLPPLWQADLADKNVPVGNVVVTLILSALTVGCYVLGGRYGNAVSEEERRHWEEERRRKRVLVKEATRSLKEGRANPVRLWETIYDEAENAFIVSAPFSLGDDIPGVAPGWFSTLVEALGSELAGALGATSAALEAAEEQVQRCLRAEEDTICQKVLDARRKERLERLEQLADIVKRSDKAAKAFRTQAPRVALPVAFHASLQRARGLLSQQERIRRSLTWDIGRQVVDPQIAGWLSAGALLKVLMGAPAPLQVLALSDAARSMARGGEEGYAHFSVAIWNCFLFFCMEKLLQFLARITMIRGEQLFTLKLQKKVYSKMLQQDYEFFDGKPTAVLQNLVHQSTEQVCTSLIFVRVRILQVLATVFFQVVLLAWRFPDLALVVNMSLPLGFFARHFSKGYIERSGSRLKARGNIVGQRTWDVLANMPTVRAHCRERGAIEDYTRCMVFQSRINTKLQIFSGMSQPLLHFFETVCVYVGYFYGGLLIRAGSLTVAELMTVVKQFQNVSGELAIMLDTIANSMIATEHGRDILELLHSRPRIEPELFLENGADVLGCRRPHEGARRTNGGRGGERLDRTDIEFRDVTFSYPWTAARQTLDDHRVLKGVSFVAKQGEFTALVGKTGCGKSTITMLLQRLYDVTGGALLVGGVDVREQDVMRLRRNIAVVSQEPVLFGAPVHENLVYAIDEEAFAGPDAAADLEGKMIDACRRADAWEFVQKLPDGLHTDVGPRGSQLSGGQKQRLTIARAILKDAPILILDEATSSLDVEAERAVQQALDSLIGSGGGATTRLVVAHRLSTVRRADRIVAIANGVVEEEGTHDQLVAQDGMYARFRRLAEGCDGNVSHPSEASPTPSASPRTDVPLSPFTRVCAEGAAAVDGSVCEQAVGPSEAIPPESSTGKAIRNGSHVSVGGVASPLAGCGPAADSEAPSVAAPPRRGWLALEGTLEEFERRFAALQAQMRQDGIACSLGQKLLLSEVEKSHRELGELVRGRHCRGDCSDG